MWICDIGYFGPRELFAVFLYFSVLTRIYSATGGQEYTNIITFFLFPMKKNTAELDVWLISKHQRYLESEQF